MELHSDGAGTGAGAWTGTGATGAEVAAASSAASAVGAAAVLRPADLIDGDTAKASAPQGKPPTTGVIPSHDHCSHTRITVTVEEGEEGEEDGESGRNKKRGQEQTGKKWFSEHEHLKCFGVFSGDLLYHLDYKNTIKNRYEI